MERASDESLSSEDQAHRDSGARPVGPPARQLEGTTRSLAVATPSLWSRRYWSMTSVLVVWGVLCWFVHVYTCVVTLALYETGLPVQPL